MKLPHKDYPLANVKLEPVRWDHNDWREVAQAIGCLGLALVVLVMAMCL